MVAVANSVTLFHSLWLAAVCTAASDGSMKRKITSPKIIVTKIMLEQKRRYQHTPTHVMQKFQVWFDPSYDGNPIHHDQAANVAPCFSMNFSCGSAPILRNDLLQ